MYWLALLCRTFVWTQAPPNPSPGYPYLCIQHAWHQSFGKFFPQIQNDKLQQQQHRCSAGFSRSTFEGSLHWPTVRGLIHLQITGSYVVYLGLSKLCHGMRCAEFSAHLTACLWAFQSLQSTSYMWYSFPKLPLLLAVTLSSKRACQHMFLDRFAQINMETKKETRCEVDSSSIAYLAPSSTFLSSFAIALEA